MSAKRLTALVAVPMIATLLVSIAAACPFCAAPEQTLSEQLTLADAAVLVQWVKGTPANSEKGQIGETHYEIVEVVRQPEGELEKGASIRLDRYRPGKPGDLFVLMGTKGEAFAWGSPMEVTETSFNYLKQAPGKEVPSVKRLPYFLKFLEYPDPLVANDAYSEFAGAPYQDIEPLADQFSAEKLRSWIANPQTQQNRIGFYGLMLGLCGGKEDGEFLKQEILKPVEQYRLGVDGIMAGYLMMTQDEGVKVLEETKLRDTTVPFSETYAAMQALRFMWTYSHRIEKPRLREAMRVLLARPEVADLVITDLARWEDWDVMDKLMEMYDAPAFNNNQTKRSIIRYFLTMAKKQAAATEESAVKNLEKAKTHLAELKQKDPNTYRQAEKFLFLN